MANTEAARPAEAGGPDISDNLPVVDGISVFEHNALLDAQETALRERPFIRKVLGGIAVASKVVLKKSVELGAVGAIGALAGLTWMGVPLDGLPTSGTLKLQENGTATANIMQPNGGESSSVSVESPVPFFGARATLKLPVEVTKDKITPPSEAQMEGAASLLTNYDQLIDQGIDNGITYGMLYGFIAISAYLGLQIVYQENKNKAWFPETQPGSLGKIVLAGGLAFSLVSPSTFIETQAVAGTSIGSEFPGAPKEVGNVKISGAILDFIQNRREYFEHMSQAQKKALKGISPLFNQDHVVKMLVIDGSGCDTGTTRLDGEAADELDTDVTEDLGDRELGSTPFDEFCSEDSANQLKGHRVNRVLGDHDDTQLYHAGWITNLNDATVENAGVRTTGINDPYVVLSGKNKQKPREDASKKDHGPLTRAEASAALAKQACSDQEKHPYGPSIVAANQESVVRDALEQDCATVVLSGGTSASKDVYVARNGKVIQYQVIRANGVKLSDRPAKGLASIHAQLPHEGQVLFLGFDTQNGAVFSQAIIRAPEGSVKLGPLEYEASAFIPKPTS